MNETTSQVDHSVAITAIMPVYNGEAFIVKSLPPLIAMQQRGEIIEMIVVDDTSTDSSSELARSMGATVLSSGGRLGPGAARNVAAEHAQGNILWFVDADVIVHEDAARILAVAFTQAEIVAVFGSYDEDPPAKNFFSRYKNLVHHYYHQHAREEAQTFWSGCGAVERTAFLACGGFDVDKYRYPSIEDIELGHRLIHCGGRIHLRRDIQCTHLKVWTFGNLLHTEIFRRAIPWSRLIIGSGEGIPNDLNVGMGEQFRALVAGLFALVILAVLGRLLSPWFFFAALLVVLLVNREIIGFFLARGGFWFAVRGFLFHQVYYLYSGVAFCAVMVEQVLYRLSGRTPPAA